MNKIRTLIVAILASGSVIAMAALGPPFTHTCTIVSADCYQEAPDPTWYGTCLYKNGSQTDCMKTHLACTAIACTASGPWQTGTCGTTTCQ